MGVAHVANNIYKAFEELQTACETIEDLGECGKCPLRSYCINDTNMSFGEAVYGVSLESVKKFIGYAERLTDVGSVRNG